MLASAQSVDAPRPKITTTGLSERVVGLRGGQRLTVIDIGRDGVGEILEATLDGKRAALLVSTKGLHSAAGIIDRLLDDLADLALALWPRWHGKDASEHADRGDIIGPAISGPWLRAAARQAEAGRAPRFRRIGSSLQFAQLLRAIDPAGVVLIAEVNPASATHAAPVIQALEWCAAHRAAVVAAVPVAPPNATPYDRILYGACELVREDVPAAARFIAPQPRAHHASLIEQRVEAALKRDAELKDLFSCNETVPIGPWGQRPRVDLLCRKHRVVVELDGPEHRIEPKFGSDRHRDYELLLAGYLVLRITNDQVETDLQRAIEKIRAVVRLRRSTSEV